MKALDRTIWRSSISLPSKFRLYNLCCCMTQTHGMRQKQWDNVLTPSTMMFASHPICSTYLRCIRTFMQTNQPPVSFLG